MNEHVVLGGYPKDDIGGTDTGSVYVYHRTAGSWEVLTRLANANPQPGSNLGFGLSLDGDLFIAGAVGEDHSGFTDAGAVYLFDLYDQIPIAYCSGKTTSRGCVPFLTATGEASPSSGPFILQSNDHVEGQAGVFIYGFKKGALAFHGGTLCVKTPFRRVANLIKHSDGVLCSSCAGNCRVFTRNFNQLIQSGADPMLTSGQRVNIQWRQRDPLDPLGFGDNLSDGLSFLIGF